MSEKQSAKIPMARMLCPEEDEDGLYDPFRHMEIVGLHADGNGRHCSEHSCCGRLVQVGDILRIEKTLVDNSDGTTEEALCCVAVKGGEEKCRVGFVPRFLQSAPLIQKIPTNTCKLWNFLKNPTTPQKSQRARNMVELQEWYSWM